MKPIATFAAGGLWGVEAKFRQLPGVGQTRVGYTGGEVADPDYKMVCRGDTGHAEAIEIEFDPDRLSYDELLQFFWQIHNPTTLNRQGPDVGSQYRSAVFYHDATQQQQAEAMMAEITVPTLAMFSPRPVDDFAVAAAVTLPPMVGVCPQIGLRCRVTRGTHVTLPSKPARTNTQPSLSTNCLPV